MSVEEARKKLMKNGHHWGDRPTQVHHVRKNPREDRLNLNDSKFTASDDDHDEEALAVGDMNRVVEPSPNPAKCRISTSEWTLSSLIKSGERFHPVPRIAASSEPKRLLAKIENSEKTGIPLIIEGWHKHPGWPKEMFHIDNFRANDSTDIDVRNVHNWTDKSIPLSEFLAKSRAAPSLAYPEEKERLYGKDAECPKEWNKWLHEANVIPSLLLPDGPNNLLHNQPRSSHVETLMCYLGIGDTFTPCHKDLCASSGQNLMCYTESGGSSYWFMTSGSDAPQASAYFHKLNQELDHETHVATVDELSKAPFKIYIAEQKLGDLVLVPPRSCHQVVNKGGLTVKTSWSRMTLKGLETAYYHELPIYRRVCRPETYRVQSTIHYTLLRMTAELENIISHQSSPGPLDVKSQSNEFINSMQKVLQLFDSMLLDEFSPNNNQMPCLSSSLSPLGTVSPAPSNASSATLIPNEKEKEGGYIPVTCDFCGADIFQSFFECRACVSPQDLQGHRRILPGDGYVVCASCYSEGRSCKCRKMYPMQCRPFDELMQHRNKARNALHLYTGDNGWLERLDFPSTTGTFRAACQLQRVREKGTVPRICTLPKGPKTHSIDNSSSLCCKGCHSSKCFIHILKMYRIHSVEAILQQAADETHQEYHIYHRMSKEKYDKGSESLLSSQYEGSRPNPSHQRAYTALTYRNCKPVNSAYAGFGWYDVYVQIHQEPGLVSEGFSSVSLEGKPRSPKPVSPSLIVTQTHTSSHNAILGDSITITTTSPDSVTRTSISSPRKRKRLVFAYVELPPRRCKVTDSKNTPTLLNADDGNVLENAVSRVVLTHKNSNSITQTSPTSEFYEPRQSRISLPEAPKSDRSPSVHKLASPVGQYDLVAPTPSPTPLPPLIPMSDPGPSTHLVDRERSRTPKRSRVVVETPAPTTNPLKSLRFTKTPTERPISPSYSLSHVERSGDMLARVYNASALHNHTITLNAELYDDYLDSENQVSNPRNTTPIPPSHYRERDNEIFKLREEIDSLRQQVKDLSQNSHQKHSPSMGGLLQVCWHEPPQNPNHSQQAPANWPPNYPDWEHFTHPHAWHPTPNAPGAPRNQRPPRGRNQNGHTYRFQPKSRRYNPPYPPEYRDYVNHSYRPRRSELHRPQASSNPENSRLGRMSEKWKQTRPLPHRRLERLSYERPSNISQTSQTSNGARDSSTTIQSGTTPVISNIQRSFEPPKPPFPEKRPGSRFETRARADPPSPSLESVSNELSANWEDGYEQDDPEMLRGHIFKDSAKTKTQQQLSPRRPSALSTFDDPMLNPWINN